jgi:hypothetical protein
MPRTTPQVAIVKLSERARILVHQMLDCHEEPASIARAIALATHERIAASTVAAYAKQYAVKVQAKQDARQRTSNLIAEMLRKGADVTELLRAAFYEGFHRLAESGTLRDMNPLLFEAVERKRIELDLHKKQVSLAERRVQVFEERLHLDRKKAQAITQKLERKARCGSSVTPQEIRQIREIYGVYDSTDRDARAEERSLRRLEPSAEPP